LRNNRKDYFIPIANIVLDSELFTFGKKQGNKNTMRKIVILLKKK